MGPRERPPWARAALIGAGAGLAALALLGPLAPFRFLLAYLALALCVIAAAAYIVWSVHPAWTFSAALVLSVFSGNWQHLGVPGSLALDRLLFVAGIAAIVLRAPPVRNRAPLTFGAAHWAMVVALLWFTGSALAAGTLGESSSTFEILERVGLIPFALFLVAPVAFATEYHRRILLGAIFGLGAYLGFTALMETLDFRQLVFPDYINNMGIGIHKDRARGPFLTAVTNGAGLYLGVVGAGLALALWRSQRWRMFAAAVLILCFAGLLFTETRSVWLGGAVATVVALLSTTQLRRYSIPAIAGGVVVVAVSLAIVPGLAQAVQERRDDDRTVWDRKNLATAALNMIEEEPLVGIGYGRFTAESADYFRLNFEYPLTAVDQVLHNVYLTYAAEAGLVGLGLWLTALGLGMFAALWPPGRGEPRMWQVAVLSYLVFFLVIGQFVFTQALVVPALWLLAGVAVGAGRPETPEEGAGGERVPPQDPQGVPSPG